MLLLRSFGIIIVVAVVNTMGVYFVRELGPYDESYVQPQSEFSTKMGMLTSVKTILKPSIHQREIKKGTKFLKSIEFFCYMNK